MAHVWHMCVTAYIGPRLRIGESGRSTLYIVDRSKSRNCADVHPQVLEPLGHRLHGQVGDEHPKLSIVIMLTMFSTNPCPGISGIEQCVALSSI
jgi:hypothetical protein